MNAGNRFGMIPRLFAAALMLIGGVAIAQDAPSEAMTKLGQANSGAFFFGTIMASLTTAMSHKDVITAAAKGLLIGLGMLEMIQFAIRAALASHDSIERIMFPWARILVLVILYMTFVQVGPELLTHILGGFKWIASKLTGLPRFDAELMFFRGQEIGLKIIGSVGVVDLAMKPLVVFILVLASLSQSLAFFIAGVQLLLAQIEALVVILAAPLLFAFGGLRQTRDMAMKPFIHAISTGFKFICVAILAYIMEQYATFATGVLSNSTGIEQDFAMMYELICSGVLLILLSIYVPSIANSMLSGAATLTAGHAISPALGIVGGAATIGASAATLGAGAVAGAAKFGASGLQQLGGVIQAANAGMAAASDAGKSGLSAVTHAAGEVASAAGSVFGGRFDTAVSSAGQSIGRGVAESFGGQVASQVEAQRGGAISGVAGANTSSSVSPTPAAVPASSSAKFEDSKRVADTYGYNPNTNGSEASIGGEPSRPAPAGVLDSVASAAGKARDMVGGLRDAAATIDDRTAVQATIDHRGNQE